MSTPARRRRVAIATSMQVPATVMRAYASAIQTMYRKVIAMLRAEVSWHPDSVPGLGWLDAVRAVAVRAVNYVRAGAKAIWNTLTGKLLARPSPVGKTHDAGMPAALSEAQVANELYVVKPVEEYFARVEAGQPGAEVMLLTKAGTTGDDQAHKTAVLIDQVRAQNAGYSRYVWTTMHDDKVRPLHRENDGGVFTYGVPVPNGQIAPGATPNCRCYPVPYSGQGMELAG